MKKIKNFETFVNELSTTKMLSYADDYKKAQESGRLAKGEWKREVDKESEYACDQCGKKLDVCKCDRDERGKLISRK